MLDPQVWIALIAGVASIAVALIQARVALRERQRRALAPGTAGGAAHRSWLGWGALVVLNLLAIVAAGSWAYAGVVDIGGDAREYERLVEEARESGRPYILEAVTAHVRLEDVYNDSTNTGTGHRNALVRITYVVRPLRDVSDSEGTFVEEFRLNPSKIPEHWYGTNAEDRGNDIGNTYNVRFGGSVGEVHTIVTGSNYTYSLPMPEGRVITDGVTRLSADEDYYMYLNTEDYIGLLTVIIESPTTPLRRVERGAFRNQPQQPTVRSDAFLNGEFGQHPRQRSMSASWRHLRPGQSGGIIYAWQQAEGSNP